MKETKETSVRDYVECACTAQYHLMRFTWWNDDPSWKCLFVEVSLSPRDGFFKRIWNALRYIFSSRYTYISETILHEDGVRQVKGLCERWLADNAKEMP